MGGDTGSGGFLLSMFVITLGGIFVISTLIGILNTGLEGKLAELRKGRSTVVERDHTVILGWSQQIHTVISEIVEANANQPRRSIVILADRDKVEMEEEIRGPGRQDRARRSSSAARAARWTSTTCASSSPSTARSIVVLAPEGDEPDADVIKTILAITNDPDRRPEPYHVVAEIRDRANLEVARMVGRDEVELVLSEEVIARITAQTCRQSGLSVVYSELLDFAGDEIYLTEQPALDRPAVRRDAGGVRGCVGDRAAAEPAGRRTSTPLGHGHRRRRPAHRHRRGRRPDQPRRRCPRHRRGVAARGAGADAGARSGRWSSAGTGGRQSIIAELDAYVAAGSETLVLAAGAGIEADIARLEPRLTAQRITFQGGDATDRATLDRLGVETFDHIIVLCYDSLDPSRADARTLITLLHLRDIAARLDRDFSIVSEMLDLRDRALAEVARADDFIVSDRLISLMIAQVAETKHLNAVFGDLLDPEGSEIYLKPAGDYVELGQAVPFAAVIEAARRRGEIAFGYRIAARAEDASAAYGVSVNPAKTASVTFAAADRIVVLAED